MNLLKQYLVPGYKANVVKREKIKELGLSDDTKWVYYSGRINCYGNTSYTEEYFPLDKWKTIKKQGYFWG